MNKKSKKICPNCHVSGYDHDGWTCTGIPHFVCQSCKSDWTAGIYGNPYYENALSHPKEIIILGWTQEDYNEYNLKLEDRSIHFERK